MRKSNFFNQTVPAALLKLTNEHQPLWGEMNAEEMVDHLRRGLLISQSSKAVEIITPLEKLPGLKRFLMSDKPFLKNFPKPKAYSLTKPFSGNLEALKVELQHEIERMHLFFQKYPNFTAAHPNFGVLSTLEWLHLHEKHFTHHFTQFNLL